MCLKHTVVKKLGRKKRTRHVLSRSPLTGKRVSSFLLFPHLPYLSQVLLCVWTKNRTFLRVTFFLVFTPADNEGNECHRRAIKIRLIRHLKSPSMFNLDVVD